MGFHALCLLSHPSAEVRHLATPAPSRAPSSSGWQRFTVRTGGVVSRSGCWTKQTVSHKWNSGEPFGGHAENTGSQSVLN